MWYILSRVLNGQLLFRPLSRLDDGHSADGVCNKHRPLFYSDPNLQFNSLLQRFNDDQNQHKLVLRDENMFLIISFWLICIVFIKY